MRVLSPEDYEDRAAGSITLEMLKETKRPIGFARDWPQESKRKKKRKKRKKRA